MELDKRSSHWIITFSQYHQPTDDDIIKLKATYILAKYSSINHTLSIWYTFAKPQRASAVTAQWTTKIFDNIVIKSTKLVNLETYKHVQCQWEYETSIHGNQSEVTSDDETILGIVQNKLRRKQELVQQIHHVETLRAELSLLERWLDAVTS